MTLSHDVRYGIRIVFKSPAFVIAAVLSVVLGIGANTTICTMINAVFLQPLPVEKPAELMYVYRTDTNNSNNVLGTFLPVSYPNFADYRAQNGVFADTGAYGFPISVGLGGGEKPTPVLAQLVSGNHFALLGVHIAVGRGFIPQEDRAPAERRVAVLNYRFWQRRFGAGREIIGEPDNLKTTIERELRSLDRDVAVNAVLTGPELLNISLFGQRMSATLLSIFGGVALILAAVGISGVMSHSISQRAPEIGIRMALGASRDEVLRMVLRQGMTLVGVGGAVGLLLAIAVGAAISRLLYGVRAADLTTFGTSAVVLLIVAFIADYIPARRATTVDPVTVMRYE
jgi:hypothetical protein